MKISLVAGVVMTLSLAMSVEATAATGRVDRTEQRALELQLKNVPLGERAESLLATVNYSATTVGGPNWARPFADCTGTSALGPVNYHTQPFTVTVSGNYSVSSIQDGWDGFLFVYQNVFTPGQPNTNCVAGNDDAAGIGTSEIPSVALTAGTTYIVVTTAFENGEEGSFTNTISGPGDINLVGAGPSANLGLTKSAPDGVVNGGNYRYLLSASNAGPDDATGVTVSDTLPAGVSFVSSTCGATAAGQTVSWSIGNLANGANASCELTVARAALTCSAVVNTATISGTEADPNPANNTATHSNGGADVIVDGSFEAANAPAWQQTSTNFGSPLCDASCGTGGGTAGPRTGAQWMWFGGADGDLETGSAQQSVNIPAGASTLTFGYWLGACGAGSGAGDFIRLTVGGTELWRRDATSAECGAAGYTLANVDISALAGATQIVRFESTSGTAATNTNFHIDDVSLSGSPVCVEAPNADLSITQTFNAPPSLVTGSSVGVVLTVGNAGPGAASAVTTATTLPAQLAFVGSTCGATAVGQTVTWSVGALANGATASCTINTTVATTGAITVASSVSSATTDPVAVNNNASGSLPGAPAGAPPPTVVPSLNTFGLLALVLSMLAIAGFGLVRRPS